MSYIVVDVESDGPCPGLYSMVSFGAVVLEPELNKTFHGKVQPISEKWVPEALAVSGITRAEHQTYTTPIHAMTNFGKWLSENSKGRPTMISDNPAFDWQWINYYFHTYLGANPFGFSARRIGDLYCGMKMDASLNSEWKRLHRRTKHDHNPVNDAMGNAEALLAMRRLGLKMKL
jgi:hypothetical protein